MAHPLQHIDARLDATDVRVRPGAVIPTPRKDDGMTFARYDQLVASCAEYPEIGDNLVYPALGLAGESGEYVDKIKKLWRNHRVTGFAGLIATDTEKEQRRELIKELGDVLWYINASARELGSSLEEVAAINAAKLLDRRARNVIKSEGDNR